MMLAHLEGTTPVGLWGERAVEEEVGEAHGSWVEGGLLTHLSALAQPRAAPRGAQPTRNPHNLRSRALSQKGRQGKQGIAPTTRTRSTLPFWLGRMLPLSERTLQVANSRSTPGEVFCIQGGPLLRNLELASRNSLPAVSPKPSIPPPQPATDTHAGLRPTQDLRGPLPNPEKGPPPVPTDTHTLRFQSSGPRRSRNEYLVRQSSEAQMGRAQSPPGGAECFSTHPRWWLLSFPGTGGRRGEGGEGESEEPRGCKSRAGTTSAGPTLGPAQSTLALTIGQT